MTDKELLEYAAKAAGLKFKVADDHMGVHLLNSNGSFFKYWHPLHDNDSALFLVSKLKLRAGVDADFAFCHSHTDTLEPQSSIKLIGFDASDLRRAIVNVAAEIGKAM